MLTAATSEHSAITRSVVARRIGAHMATAMAPEPMPIASSPTVPPGPERPGAKRQERRTHAEAQAARPRSAKSGEHTPKDQRPAAKLQERKHALEGRRRRRRLVASKACAWVAESVVEGAAATRCSAPTPARSPAPASTGPWCGGGWGFP